MANTPNTLDFAGMDILSNGKHPCSATLTVTSSTTPVAITGMTATVYAGATYLVRIHLNGVAAASGGITVNFGGTATATSMNIASFNYNGTTLNALTTITALASNLTDNAAAYTNVIAFGTFVCATGGTLILQMGQHTSNATSSTVLANSFLEVIRS